MIIPETVYALFCVILAAFNHERIKDGKRINHFWNGLIHLAVAIPASIFIHLTVGLVLLLNANVIFNVSLNLFRGLPIGYLPLKPKSVVDQVEKKLFGNGIAPKIIYTVISICLNIFYFTK